jgi:excisionase family DNA binding protein
VSGGPTWLTVPAAAARMGVHRSTLWRWIATGVVPRQAVLLSGRRARVATAWADGRQGIPA